MARVCEISGSKTSSGFSRRHQPGKAGGVSGPWSRKAQATKRTWRPNLTDIRVIVDGVPRKMTVSMKAYKQLKRDGRIGNVVLNNKRSTAKQA